jgi:peptide/nickel transport system substrate-binding protein
MERVPEHWNAANIHVQRVVMLPIPDSNVRLLNLRAGQLDLIERVAPTDVDQARRMPRITVTEATAIAYQTIYLNVAGGALRDPRLRQALELSIDRRIINEVALQGLFVPNNQPEPPGTSYHFADLSAPARDIDAAKALLRAAGRPSPEFTLLTPNSPVEAQVAEIIQSMAAEAGFRVRILTMEATAITVRANAGQFDAAFGIWSGRADPDGNIALWIASDGFLNRMGYRSPMVDAAFTAGRQTTDGAERRRLYQTAATQWLGDRPMLILYHYRWFWGMRAGMTGFEPARDGLIRFSGLRLPPG